MKIGIAAATTFEIQSTINFLAQSHPGRFQHTFETVITGIGSLATAYHLTRFITRQSPALMIQAGIGGSFGVTFPPGATVLVREEILADLGVEENNLFNDVFDMGLMKESLHPFSGKRLVNPGIGEWAQYGLLPANGLTVNEITTQEKRIRLLKEKYSCDIESMEGAAFHYVCLQENISFMQMRSISNYVGERDKKKWKLQQAIENLNDSLKTIIQQIT